MHNEVSVTPRYRKIWEDVSHWLKILDEAVDYDPHEPIVRKLEQLESRLAHFEKLHLTHQEQSLNTQRTEAHNVH